MKTLKDIDTKLRAIPNRTIRIHQEGRFQFVIEESFSNNGRISGKILALGTLKTVRAFAETL